MVLNYFAVLVAAMAAMVVGSMWYSPLAFGKHWMRLRGQDPEKMKDRKMPLQSMLIEFACALITAYVLAIFTVAFGAHNLYSTILLGIIVWVGFYVTLLLGEVVWEGKPFMLFLINAGLRLVNVVIMTVIVGLWQ
jgi:hypothetical protein